MDSGVGSDVLAFAQQQVAELDLVYRSEILAQSNGSTASGRRTRTTTAEDSSSSTPAFTSTSTTATTTTPASVSPSPYYPPLARSKSSSATNLPALNPLANITTTSNDYGSSAPPPTGKVGESSLSLALDDLLAALGDTINELQDEEEKNDARRASVAPPLAASAEIAQFSVGYLLQSRIATYSGFLNKLSISRTTGARIWKRRFLILHSDARVFLFRSSNPTELPLTFLPLFSASGSLFPPTPEGGGGYILDLYGQGIAPDGTQAERVWSLQCPDEHTMNAWLDSAHAAVHEGRFAAKRPSVASASSNSGSYNTTNLAYPASNGVLRVAPPMPVPIPSNPANNQGAYFPHKFPPSIQTGGVGVYAPTATSTTTTPASPLSSSFGNPATSPASSYGATAAFTRRPSTATSGSQASRRPSSAAFGLDHYGSSPPVVPAAVLSLPSPAPSASSASEKQLERERLQRMQYEAYLVQMARAQQEAQLAYEREQRAQAGRSTTGGDTSPMPSTLRTGTPTTTTAPAMAMAREPSVPAEKAQGAGPGPMAEKPRGRGEGEKKKARSKSTKRMQIVDVDMSMFT
ncbi:hypothetical protein HDU96_007828 [Phlyctochytrium bullatum]|nr:hypothetical protein HDU96_007828 [Phlyctochytrium bullatum]